MKKKNRIMKGRPRGQILRKQQQRRHLRENFKAEQHPAKRLKARFKTEHLRKRLKVIPTIQQHLTEVLNRT